MDQDRTSTPPGWTEALARSEAEAARGELIPAADVHEELRRAIAELEAELAGDSEAPTPSLPRR